MAKRMTQKTADRNALASLFNVQRICAGFAERRAKVAAAPFHEVHECCHRCDLEGWAVALLEACDAVRGGAEVELPTFAALVLTARHKKVFSTRIVACLFIDVPGQNPV